MDNHVVVIGAGINGLVAANYLKRSGFQVTHLERKQRVGGACTSDIVSFDGREYEYPSGATVLGFMQDFVYKDTGLSKRLAAYAPKHPAIVYAPSTGRPCFIFDDIERLRAEVKDKWGEEAGNIAGFYSDFERVREFLIDGYKKAEVPTLESARSTLGADLTELWIAGSARNLLNHYLECEMLKVYLAMDVMESGPVSIDSPFSAFTMPLMSSGSVFGGKWGFVKGGLWKLAEELCQINSELGVKLVQPAEVIGVEGRATKIVRYRSGDGEHECKADQVVFATDPLSAAKLVGEDDVLRSSMSAKKSLGTSGKLVMLFREPVEWKDISGESDFDMAFRFIVSVDTLDELERVTQAAAGGDDFVPGYFEIYCEGAGMRKLGLNRGYESLTVFFKNLAFNKGGADLLHVKREVESIIMSKIANAGDFIGSVLLTPRDLHERFLFPQGNIDHIELCEGQTYFSRNYSPDPHASFYQFGSSENLMYCGAGSYPCGSIAGTPGYMCAVSMARRRALSSEILVER